MTLSLVQLIRTPVSRYNIGTIRFRYMDGDITLLLRQWGDGRDEAFRELLPLAYSRLRLVAGACMRQERPDHTLQPTALVGELYLRLANGKQSGWDNREHFYRFCARAMRWILTDHAKSRLREKRRSDLQLPLTEDIPWLGDRDSDAVDLDRALAKLAENDPVMARIVELRIYLGCTANETAGILCVSKPTVDRNLTVARAWLCRELRPDGGERDVPDS
jgi:RNA polymerase sigma factor (TIGR02999 family)